jgi:hypothetical protein
MSINNHFESTISGPLDNANVKGDAATSTAMLTEVFQAGYQIPQTDSSRGTSNANNFLPPVSLDSSTSSPAPALKVNSFESAGNVLLSSNPISEIGTLAQEWQGLDSGTSMPQNQDTINPVRNYGNQPFRLI